MKRRIKIIMLGLFQVWIVLGFVAGLTVVPVGLFLAVYYLLTRA